MILGKTMRRRIGSFLVGLFTLLPSLGTAEQAMGRLFLTPEQRARMDVARRQERNISFDLEQEARVSPPAHLVLNGVVTRSDGKTTLWINNKVQGGEQMGLDIAVPGRGKAMGQVSVTPPDARRPVALRVGQSIDLGSGRVDEIYRRTPPGHMPKQENMSTSIAPGAVNPPLSPRRKAETPSAR
jgi:hypothetical protein